MFYRVIVSFYSVSGDEVNLLASGWPAGIKIMIKTLVMRFVIFKFTPDWFKSLRCWPGENDADEAGRLVFAVICMYA